MTSKKWLEKVDPMIKDQLKKQILETHKQEKALKEAKDPKTVQLWIAIANLAIQNFELNLKITYLERALKDLAGKKTRKTSKKEKEEVDKLLKTLSRY